MPSFGESFRSINKLLIPHFTSQSTHARLTLESISLPICLLPFIPAAAGISEQTSEEAVNIIISVLIIFLIVITTNNQLNTTQSEFSTTQQIHAAKCIVLAGKNYKLPN